MADTKFSQIADGSAFVVVTDKVVTLRNGTTDLVTTLGTLATQNGTFSGTSSGTNTGDQTITLTGDITGSGTGSFAASIGANKVTTTAINANAVTYPKIQATTQAALLGASSATTVGEITLGTNLTFSGSVLNAASTAATAFSAITGSTNTTAAMVVGTGSSLAASGSGTIVATSTTGNAATVTTNANLTGNVTSVGNATTIATNVLIMSVGVTLDGGGSALSTGQKGYLTCPFAGTIVGWNITADTGTCTFDVWKIATGTAVPTVSNTITASAKPALATGTAIHSTGLSGWTTSVSANDIFGFNLDAVSGATKITLVIQINKT